MTESEDSWHAALAKEKRREEGGKDPRLERRRFLLARSPELRERLNTVKKVFAKVQASRPELIALNFYGSHTRGYAAPESDIDMCVAVDNTIDPEKEWEGVRILRDRLWEALDLPSSKLSLSPYGVGGTELISPSVRARPFMLSIGKDIYELRRKYIEKLEQIESKAQGNGEDQWKDIATFLWHTETQGFPEAVREKRKAMYPWTLAEARAYFLRGEPKTKEATPDS